MPSVIYTTVLCSDGEKKALWMVSATRADEVVQIQASECSALYDWISTAPAVTRQR